MASLPYTCTNISHTLHCNFPQFVAKLDVCTLLHCTVTLPPTLTTFNWPQSVFAAGHMQSMLCVDSPHVFEKPCACMHTCAKLVFRYHTIHQTFRHTLYTKNITDYYISFLMEGHFIDLNIERKEFLLYLICLLLSM